MAEWGAWILARGMWIAAARQTLNGGRCRIRVNLASRSACSRRWTCSTHAARAFAAIVAVVFSFAFAAPLRAEPDPTNAVINKGLSYLLAQQGEDGAFREGPQRETALTSLAIMALTSVGHMPTDTSREGEAVRKGLAFILRDDRVTNDGYFGAADGSRMYGHGITTLMLTEMLGMGADAAQDELIRLRCQTGVGLILRSQGAAKKLKRHVGGWRYQPDAIDADLSVSVWNIVALRSAKNVGIEVPKPAIDSAVEFVKRCYRQDQSGYGYGPQTPASRELTAAAVLIFMLTDHADLPEIQLASAKWLRGAPPANEQWLYYSCYYVAQATNQLGGERADVTRRGLESLLAKKQDATGFWDNPTGRESAGGKIYCTSLAILSLSVKDHYLPIYQK